MKNNKACVQQRHANISEPILQGCVFVSMQIQYQIHGFIVRVNWTRSNKILKIINLYLRVKTVRNKLNQKKREILVIISCFLMTRLSYLSPVCIHLNKLGCALVTNTSLNLNNLTHKGLFLNPASEE